MQEPKVIETSKEASITNEVKDTKEFKMEQYFESIRNGSDETLKKLLESLEDYSKLVKPGMLIDGDVGARHQRSLYNTIRGVMASAPDKFKSQWILILNYANNHITFTERYIYRFSESWIWDTADLSAFQRIINLILLTKDHTARQQGLKQVNLDRTLELVFTQEEKQNITVFYS